MITKNYKQRFFIKSLKNYRTLIMGLLASLALASCENYLEVDPPKNELVSESVFETDASATSVVTGIYSRMISSLGLYSGHNSSIAVLAGLYSDELDYLAGSNAFYENNLTPNDSYINFRWWGEPYSYIYTCNVVLENLENNSGLSESTKTQLRGEALFIRAFCYFYLVNSFGDVPLHVSSDYASNALRSRSSVATVYHQIITDLKESRDLLPDNYNISNNERVRPNRYAASALLSRIYLYTKEWELAEQFATEVIANTNLYQLELDLDKAFLKDSSEAIWQLYPVYPGLNTIDGFAFIATTTPPRVLALTTALTGVFETDDLRKQHWMASVTNGTQTWYYPFKYKVRASSQLTEYSMVLRLSEQVLIRAEARAQQEHFLLAHNDINAIRNKAGLEDLPESLGKEALLEAIYKERQCELFTEWGHRWFDLKRTGKANLVLDGIKPNWDASDILFPIPNDELLRNPNMTPNP